MDEEQEDIFPVFDDLESEEFVDEYIDEEFIEDAGEEVPPLGFTWKFDFEAGDIYTGRNGRQAEVRGRDVIREWVGHTLNTERFESSVFGGDIGTIINKYIGSTSALDGHTRSRIEQDITEALLVHDRIQQVLRLTLVPLGHDLYIFIRYESDEEIYEELAQLG